MANETTTEAVNERNEMKWNEEVKKEQINLTENNKVYQGSNLNYIFYLLLCHHYITFWATNNCVRL